MAWNGEERRSGKERRTAERRRTLRYSSETVIVVDGVTWVDIQGSDRRRLIRRLEDRQRIAAKIVEPAKE